MKYASSRTAVESRERTPSPPAPPPPPPRPPPPTGELKKAGGGRTGGEAAQGPPPPAPPPPPPPAPPPPPGVAPGGSDPRAGGGGPPPLAPHHPPDDGHAGRRCHPRDLPRGHAALAGRAGEGVDERPRGARPVCGRLREPGCERALEMHRKRGAHGANRTRRVVDHACGDRLPAGSGKRRPTRQHFVQHPRPRA